MQINLNSEWQTVLSDELQKPYFQELMETVVDEYDNSICYPPKELIFSSFNYCSFKDLKVVIIGQDPYHGEGEANGLCFSVNDGIPFPPSLQNIFKEIETDLNIPLPKTGNLERWADQGVFLLNATLTVRQSEAGSHQGKGWEKFTDAVIKQISAEKENVVFLLWGGFAQKKAALIDASKHHILKSGHPSPLSANRGFWFGNKHFSQTNAFLKSKELKEIEW